MKYPLPKKILWISLKITNREPTQGAIIELGAIATIDGEVKKTFETNMAPFTGAWVDDNMLERACIGYSKILDFPPLEQGMEQFIEFLDIHVNRFAPKDKFIMAGMNVIRIDSQFIRNYFEYIENSFYGSYFFPLCLDIDSLLVRMILEKSIRLKIYSFENVCNYFEIDLPISRSALSDAETKMKLYQIIERALIEDKRAKW